jgi:hypothetical protein
MKSRYPKLNADGVFVAWIDCSYAQCGVVLTLASAFLQEKLTTMGHLPNVDFLVLRSKKTACAPHAWEQ